MGAVRHDALTLLLLTLPGVAFTYSGDEIGMLDYRDISWNDTMDLWACNTNQDDYKELSRDPQRTPFQWDATINAGFNNGSKTYIAVHPYFELTNLARQQQAPNSFYKFYQQLIKLRKNDVFVYGEFQSRVIKEDVFAFRRTFNNVSYVILINLSIFTTTLDVNELGVDFPPLSEIVWSGSRTGYSDIG